MAKWTMRLDDALDRAATELARKLGISKAELGRRAVATLVERERLGDGALGTLEEQVADHEARITALEERDG